MNDLDQLILALASDSPITSTLLGAVPVHPDIPVRSHVLRVIHDGTDVTAALQVKEALVPDLGCAMNLELGLVRMYGKRLPGSVGHECKGKLGLSIAITCLLALQDIRRRAA